jgi:DNA-binding MarR family transcriptional regulator
VVGLTSVIVAAQGYRLAAADHFGLDLVETHVIGNLDAHGPMSQGRLAQLLGLTSGGVTGVVDRLENAGTVRRVADPHDRRRRRIELTERARRILVERNETLARTFTGLEPEVVQTLVDALPRLAAGLDREAAALRH